ncbi:hypothetical protein CLOM_g19262, partial [Closterium sp. NIES-68]
LYVARTRHYTPNVLTFGYSFKQWTEYWALLTTGELYLGLPHGDPRHFDFHADRRTNPHRFVPLSHAHGRGAAGNDVVFKRVQPCEAEDGCRLDGRFVHEAARDFVDAAEASGVKGVTTVSFRPDGTFSVDDEDRGGRGEYEIRGNGIELRYEGGAWRMPSSLSTRGQRAQRSTSTAPRTTEWRSTVVRSEGGGCSWR